jgi:hypothetical protein
MIVCMGLVLRTLARAAHGTAGISNSSWCTRWVHLQQAGLLEAQRCRVTLVARGGGAAIGGDRRCNAYLGPRLALRWTCSFRAGRLAATMLAGLEELAARALDSRVVAARLLVFFPCER